MTPWPRPPGDDQAPSPIVHLRAAGAKGRREPADTTPDAVRSPPIGATLRAASAATSARLVPGRGVPLARHLTLLAECLPPTAPRVWTDAEALTAAACFSARARRDALSDGADLVRRAFDGVRLRRPAQLSSAARSQLYAGAGEYCTAAGRPQMGARFGAEALLFADTPALRYRALSVMALGRALNGEIRAAQASIDEALTLFRDNGWDASEAAYAEMTARGTIAVIRMDTAGLKDVAAQMRAVHHDDAYAVFTADAFEVGAMMFTHDFAAALAAGRNLLLSGRRRSSHRMLRYFVVSVMSDLMVAHGDHLGALDLLRPYDSPEGHGACFAMQRSAALLALGREQELLDGTEGCVSADLDHCLRTLVPVLARRAIALLRTGNERAARESMRTALFLVARNGMSAAPFLMLPGEEAGALVDDALRSHPELAEPLAPVLRQLHLVTVGDVRGDSPVALTPTEHELVQLLRRGRTNDEIARARGVSPNTVKSQLRSIYRKLGVATRAEVIGRLDGTDD
ncbi:LuxR family transcriptional regulator [uncultured Microbacterium sp.]|uniref:helix-turn-helix transcriptional regulator n=1 Tax=uncultured Microbacterium sp. TaxID=191216 RepID=UPI0025D9A6E4|nr:LuxR family transcriptional regulator [uncultured Microbacterium sp.]